MLLLSIFAAAIGWCHPGVAGGRLVDRQSEAPVPAPKVQHDADRLSLFLENGWDASDRATGSPGLEVLPDEPDAADGRGSRGSGEGGAGGAIAAQEAPSQLPRPAPEGKERPKIAVYDCKPEWRNSACLAAVGHEAILTRRDNRCVGSLSGMKGNEEKNGPT